MNKADLIGKVAKSSGMSKAAAEKVLDGFIEAVRTALHKGQNVSLIGFGTFRVSKRAARTGRNPRTGEPIKIVARKVPRFSAGSVLKNAVR